MPIIIITTVDGVDRRIDVDDVQTYLDGLPPKNITEIYIGKCNLTVINNLSRFTKLKRLDCFENELTTLPELPDSLKELSCCDNRITSLPKLPESL